MLAPTRTHFLTDQRQQRPQRVGGSRGALICSYVILRRLYEAHSLVQNSSTPSGVTQLISIYRAYNIFCHDSRKATRDYKSGKITHIKIAADPQ
jgi:hypothetical protein